MYPLHGVGDSGLACRPHPGNPRARRESRATLTQVWRELLPPGSRCALALYPDHWNAGDAAIWWGTRRFLADLGVTIVHACDPWSYDPQTLRTALPEGPILLLGGGNFGDVYPREQSLRMRILSDFADLRIIQLPLSIWFRTAGAAAEMARLLARQRDVTLLVRDEASLALAQERFPTVTARRCPDAALALDLSRLGSPDVAVVALLRDDAEALGPLPSLPADWIERAGGVGIPPRGSPNLRSVIVALDGTPSRPPRPSTVDMAGGQGTGGPRIAYDGESSPFPASVARSSRMI
ncbi:MAG: polysaccharide pyruvyl transferase family protein [Planctomycetota bacterium]